MGEHKTGRPDGRAVYTIVVLVLCVLTVWFLSLPETDYEVHPNRIESIRTAEYISPEGISQSLTSRGNFRGIRVRWATNKTVPENEIYAELFRQEDGTLLDRIVIPASAVRNNEETEIVFSGTYGPGAYRVRLTCPEDSEDTVTVWTSITDAYSQGNAMNADGGDEGYDWCFQLLTAFPESMMIRHRILRAAGIVLVILACGCALAWLYGAERFRKEKRVRSAILFVQKHADRILLGLVILIPTVFYLDFLLGDRIYVFTMLDRGSDSAAQTYPVLLNTADRIRNGIWGEFFNFRQGLGDPQAAFFPTLTSWVALFGEERIGWLLGVSQWAKVVLSGVFAYGFVKERGAGSVARFAIAMGYCFNCMLVARGAWESYPNIALLVILWLYAYERRLNAKGNLLYFFSSFFMFVNFGLYDCVLYGALIPVYMLVRRIIREESGKAAVRGFLKDFGWFALFAFTGMMDTIRYTLVRTLSSSRLREGVEDYAESAGESVFINADTWFSAFLRTVGHTIGGITKNTDPKNILEGPTFYTGISVFLTVPAALCLTKGKKRRISLLFIAAALCYIAIVPLRLVANGFSKDTFKLSSYWIVILFVLLNIEFFRAAEEGRISRGAIAATCMTAAASVVLLLCAKWNGYVLGEEEWIVSLTLIILYPVLILLRAANRRIPLTRYVMIICVTVEAILVPYEMICCRHMEDRTENSRIERADTMEIISSLPEDEWYRVEKDFTNVFLSDPLAEGYRGSTSYVGGIEINPSVQEIYQAYHLPQRGNHYLYGSGGNVWFESLDGTKYLLTDSDLEFRYGYRLKETRNGIRVYENLYACPPAWISEGAEPPEFPGGQYDLSGKRLGYQMERNTYLPGFLPENSVLVIEAEFNPEVDTRGTLYIQDRQGRFSSLYFQVGPLSRIEIANDNIFSVWFDSHTVKQLMNISFYAADRDEYYAAYREYAAMAAEHNTGLKAQGENHFTGTAKADMDGYLITAIPYHKKWEVSADGEKLETTPVNGGFLGARIPAGEHRIEILYDGDGWAEGNKYKILGSAAFILTAFMVLLSRKHRKEKK